MGLFYKRSAPPSPRARLNECLLPSVAAASRAASFRALLDSLDSIAMGPCSPGLSDLCACWDLSLIESLGPSSIEALLASLLSAISVADNGFVLGFLLHLLDGLVAAGASLAPDVLSMILARVLVPALAPHAIYPFLSVLASTPAPGVLGSVLGLPGAFPSGECYRPWLEYLFRVVARGHTRAEAVSILGCVAACQAQWLPLPECPALFCAILHRVVEGGCLDVDLFLELGLLQLLRVLDEAGDPPTVREVNHIAGSLLVRGIFDFPDVTFARMLDSAHKLCLREPDASISALWLASLRIDHSSAAQFANSPAGGFFLDEYCSLPWAVRVELATLLWELVVADPADADWFFEHAGLAAKTLELCAAADDGLVLRVLECVDGLLTWAEQVRWGQIDVVLRKFAEQGEEFVAWAMECAQSSGNEDIVARSRALARVIEEYQIAAA
jgi:hypothetical protein